MVPDKLSLCQVVGGGPAGISLIIALYNFLACASGSQQRECRQLLDSILVIEASASPGGLLSSYQINANTDAFDVIKGILDGSPFTRVRDRFLKLPETQNVLIALPSLHELLMQPLVTILVELMGDRLMCNRRVVRIVCQQGIFYSYDADDSVIARSQSMVLCCGGQEKLLPVLETQLSKTLFAGDFLRFTNSESLPVKAGPVIVVGASHSGFSCVWRLLNDPIFLRYIDGREIVILQRRDKIKLRCRREFALEQNIEWNEESDVCPYTGIIFRNAGLRKDAKFLYLDIRHGKEKRAAVKKIDNLDEESELLDQAGLIIQAAGFVAKFPEVEIDGSVRRINSKSKLGEVQDAENGETIKGLFANGLGMDILPEGEFRGEKSFNGSIDGMLSYPLAISPFIIEKILQHNRESACHEN